MSGVQHLLAIAAVFLLTILILNVHKSTGDIIIITYTNDTYITYTSIVQISMVKEF